LPTRFRVAAARSARVVQKIVRPAKRGRGECRVPAAPAASCAKFGKHTSVVTTVAPEHPAFPHAMVLTAYYALSPVIGLVCHRRRRIVGASRPGRARRTFRRLDAGVEASGPHGFAVRVSAVRQRAVRSLTGLSPARPAITSRAQRCRVHRIPPRVRDDRDTPLGGTRRRELWK